MKSMPKSAIVVLHQLTEEGPMSPKDITDTLDISPRTVSFALKFLLTLKLCRKVPNLTDMRQPLYVADKDRARELTMDLQRAKAEAAVRRVMM